MSDYQVKKQGEYTDDDGLEIDMGTLAVGQAWWELPLPQCPDCGGDVVWWEAGYVPGTRKCVGSPIKEHDDGNHDYAMDGGCGSMFRVAGRDGRVVMERERLY